MINIIIAIIGEIILHISLFLLGGALPLTAIVIIKEFDKLIGRKN